MNHLHLILHQILAIIAVGYVWMGHEYMTEGYGIHPVIAGVCALSSLLLPHGVEVLSRWKQEARTRQELVNNDWLRLHPQRKY